jgi:DNA-binding LacI/PurR family transcriptional regulator
VRDGQSTLSIGEGKELVELLSLPQPPTAIISSNNKMLLGILRGLRELNYSCPEQVSVVGFDDPIWTEFFNPPLTVMAQQADEVGRRAFEMLLANSEGPKWKNRRASKLVSACGVPDLRNTNKLRVVVRAGPLSLLADSAII